ncbi:BCCT family transporter [Candidatus Nitrospira salsa]
MKLSLLNALRDWRDGVSLPVFLLAAGFNIILIGFGGLFTETAGTLFDNLLNFISMKLGWYYVLTTSFFVGFVFWLLVCRHGDVRLGDPDEEPQFSLPAWLSMLFAAGMGMGLVFWGVAEPLYHYQTPPRAEPFSSAAAQEAIQFSFFHWAFHPWAVYVIFGLGIALFHFRYKLPLAPRSLLYPLVGNRIHGWLGHIVDAFCTIGTLLGVATSLGLGAMQINAGLSQVTNIEYVTHVQIWIIVLISLVATISTVTGVSKGIKYLSVINGSIMLFLLLFVFFTGPTLFQIKLFLTGIGDYLQNLVGTSLWLDPRQDSNWQSTWTLFYWGWWISWSPFVGIFIARISRGRSIREFVVYVLLLPALVNCFWFSVFGGTAMYVERFGDGNLLEPVTENVAMSLHLLLEHLPWTSFMQWTALVLIVIFFITSSDSGSFVDDMVTSGGNPNPPVANRVFWGISEGAAAAVLLLAGGLNALQSASISAGLPQSVLLLVTCVGLIKTLRTKEMNTQEVKQKGQ